MPRNYVSSLDDIPEPFHTKAKSSEPVKMNDMMFILLVIMVFYG